MNRPASTKSIQILLTFLFIDTVIVASFHHHADLRDYSTCATCKVVSHLSANETPQIFHLETIPFLKVNMAVNAVNIYLPFISIPRQNRAPPANYYL
jgi:hypothetical protein